MVAKPRTKRSRAYPDRGRNGLIGHKRRGLECRHVHERGSLHSYGLNGSPLCQSRRHRGPDAADGVKGVACCSRSTSTMGRTSVWRRSWPVRGLVAAQLNQRLV